MDTGTEASRVPAAERVYAHVKAAVLSRTYEGGTLLSEGQLADAVGVSRTPVREALLRLEAEGLIKLFPKRGALVVPVSAEEVADVLEARELVEVHTAARAFERRAQLIPTLEPLLERMRAARQADDAVALMAADREFHAAVVAAAGNTVLHGIYGSLRDRQMRMGVTSMRLDPARMDRAVADHEALLAALHGSDAEAFRQLVRAHVQHAADALRASR